MPLFHYYLYQYILMLLFYLQTKHYLLNLHNLQIDFLCSTNQ
nr:MAG TPA: hypothetical protein [Bacteriophage sp.]